MKTGIRVWLSFFLISAILLLSGPPSLQASDHADPMALKEPESNITGLFFWPDGDNMILVLNIRRGLRNPKPYNLEPFEYVVHMDLTSAVSFNDPADRGHYGGTIVVPEKLHADANVRVRLNNDTTLNSVKFEGLRNPESIRVFSGVRDDPFVFPRFFKKNVISMVFGIPKSAFSESQHDFILWGTTYKDGQQVDHVGRSNRTQLARFDSLNTLPPNEHVKEIQRLMQKWDRVYTFFNGFKEPEPKALAALVQYVLQIRKYEHTPDVMIYSDRFPSGFPNGRRLPDDVAAQTCATGDCILQEISFVEGGWPRQTANDKPFLADWPYLAEPWPDEQEAAPSTKSIWPYLIGVLLAILLLSWLVVEIVRRALVWIWLHLRHKSAPARAT